MGNACTGSKNNSKKYYDNSQISKQQKPVFLTLSNIKIKNMSFLKAATYLVIKVGK